MTVRRLLADVDSVELAEWMAYVRLDPFGGTRGDLQSGIVAAAVMNAAGGKKGEEYFSASEFMPDFGPPKVVDPADVARKVNEAFGGIAAKFA